MKENEVLTDDLHKMFGGAVHCQIKEDYQCDHYSQTDKDGCKCCSDAVAKWVLKEIYGTGHKIVVVKL